MKHLLLAFALGFTLSCAATNQSQAQEVPLLSGELAQTVEGVSFAIPYKSRVTNSAGDGVLPYEAVFDLTNVGPAIDQILRGLNVDRVELRGTGINVEADGRLHTKVHFRVDPSGLPDSNGSVTIYFTPQVTANAITLVSSKPELRISNDITRGFAEGLNLDDKFEKKVSEALTKALSDPKASLKVPAIAEVLGVTVTGARFEVRDGKPSAVVSAELPAAARLLLRL